MLLASDCTIAIGDAAGAGAARAGRARRLARRARRLQHARRRRRPATSAACASRRRAGAGTPASAAGVDPRRVVLARRPRPRRRPSARRSSAPGWRRRARRGVAAAVRGERVFLHLDLDVLDPSEMRVHVPGAGRALDGPELRALLAQLADAADDRRDRGHLDGGAGARRRGSPRLLRRCCPSRARPRAPTRRGLGVRGASSARRCRRGSYAVPGATVPADRDRRDVHARGPVRAGEQLGERAHAGLAEREARDAPGPPRASRR